MLTCRRIEIELATMIEPARGRAAPTEIALAALRSARATSAPCQGHHERERKAAPLRGAASRVSLASLSSRNRTRRASR